MDFVLMILPYILALLGVVGRMVYPYIVKQLTEGDIEWDWREAAIPAISGLMAFVGWVASGMLDGLNWQAALLLGLTAAVSTWGAGDISKVVAKGAQAKKAAKVAGES